MQNAIGIKRLAPCFLALTLLVISAAARAGEGQDELGNGICSVVTLLTGKFLFGISVLAMVGGGSALIFGAELTDGVKKVVTIIAIVGMILSFGGILSIAYKSLSAAGC